MYNNPCIGYKRMKPSGNATTSALRKGAWTAEEDMLLKKCIEKFGEGKWHLIPLKAGLNRCRKSCRLRWLNYLRPDIKRGDFGEDEIDLMLRLHKLLGNRWSLIAGRIPGRTANDVKNYWNTHLRSRYKNEKEKPKDGAESSQHTMVTVIKPKPRSLSKTLNNNSNVATNYNGNLIGSSSNGVENVTNISSGRITYPRLPDDKINEYMDELLDGEMKGIDDEFECCFGEFSGVEPEAFYGVNQGDDQNNLFDFSKDETMWDLLDLGQQ